MAWILRWAARLVHGLYLFSFCANLVFAWSLLPDVSSARDIAFIGVLMAFVILTVPVGPIPFLAESAWFRDHGGTIVVVGLIVAVFGPLFARGLEAIADERDLQAVDPGPDFRRVRRAVRTWADGRRERVAGRVSPIPDARGRLSGPSDRGPGSRARRG